MHAANPLAYLALFISPFIITAAYARRRHTHSIASTTAWLMMLSTMFLPAAFEYDPPLLPAVDKHRLTFAAIWLSLFFFHRRDLSERAPEFRFPKLVLAVALLGAARTIATNGDPLFFGPTTLPGLTYYDGLSVAASLIIDWYLPFSIGLRVFRTEADLHDLFKVMSACMLIYAPLMLFEVRMSPQLHYWVYGFQPSEFFQQMRYGGFRPVVFMGHGLSVAMWVFSCVCATLALQKSGIRTKMLSTEHRLLVGAALLLFCKSLAPFIFAGLAYLIVWFVSTKTIARLAVVVAIFVVAYPLSRAEQILPVKEVTDFFYSVSPERGQSLHFRFSQEDSLLERAMQRPLTGWGTFGRGRIYSELDGKDHSVTDGYWIILLGNLGYAGFGCFFALMVAPLLCFARNQKHMSGSAQAGAAVLALMVALFTFDLLPNARSNFLSVVYAGVLWGVSHRFSHARQAVGASIADSVGKPPNQYAQVLGLPYQPRPVMMRVTGQS